MVYNLLSCGGFTEGVGGYVASSGCLKGRVGLVIMFFLIAIIRRWGGEEVGIDFSFFLAIIGGVIGYFLLITFTGSYKLAFGVGFLVAMVLGYGGGTMFGGGEE